MSRFVAWHEINNFHTVRKTLMVYPELLGASSVVEYRSKVKLHGMNAGVRIDSDGTVRAFSRTKAIGPGNDTAGFAKWVDSMSSAFAAMAQPEGDIVVYGEWCGPGIMKGVAVCQIPSKIFAVFAVRYLSGDGDYEEYDPDRLSTLVNGIADVHVIPWYDGGAVTIVDWLADAEELGAVVEAINADVLAVEQCDPFIYEAFGVKGVGEGLVFYPHGRRHSGHKNYSNLAFKAKGEKHSVVAKTKPAQVNATVVAGADAFAELVITPARLEQGARQVAAAGELVFDMKDVGAFLKWVNIDVAKETSAELEASGVDHRLAAKACSKRARDWYIEQCKKL